MLWGLALAVLNRSDASHGVFVPVIAAYLLWRRRAELGRSEARPAAAGGAAIVGAGLVLFFVSGHYRMDFLPALSFLIVAAGLITALYGMEILRAVGFPLFFLAAMIPIPRGLFRQLAEGMRTATTWGSVALVKALGLPIYRNGYHVSLPNIDLFVAPACSGVRYLIPYFVFGLAYAYLTRPKAADRVLVVLATIPLAIVAGIMRQSSVFLSAYYIGPFMADHNPHVLISWAVFVTVLVAAMWLDQTVREKRALSTAGLSAVT